MVEEHDSHSRRHQVAQRAIDNECVPLRLNSEGGLTEGYYF